MDADTVRGKRPLFLLVQTSISHTHALYLLVAEFSNPKRHDHHCARKRFSRTSDTREHYQVEERCKAPSLR